MSAQRECRYWVDPVDNRGDMGRSWTTSSLKAAREKVRLFIGQEGYRGAYIYDEVTNSVIEAFNEVPTHREFTAGVDVDHCRIRWNYTPRNVPAPTYAVWTYHIKH